jgi:hypothetical protein
MPVTNIFQHPQGLGMPIAAAALLLLSGGPGLRRFAVAAVVTGLCAQAQTVYFALLGLALVASALVLFAEERAEERAAPRLLLRLLFCGLAALIATALGNLVVGDATAALVWGRGYFAEAPLPRNLLSFGVVVLALLAALALVRRGDPRLLLPLIVCSAAGFVIGNAATYARSWDIVKLFGAGAFFASFLVVWLLCDVIKQRAVVCVVVVVSCWSGLVWIARHGPLNGRVVAWQRDAGLEAAAVSFDSAYGAQLPPHARILVESRELGRAGYLCPGTDWRTHKDTRATHAW